MRVRAGRNDVMLLRREGGIVALANRCSHRGGPLHKGSVDSDTVTCPWHLSTFKLDDGSIVCGPATAPQPSYETRVRDGMIEVRNR
jgi:nitrite reductase/ring-hydroxylating ferredoxin subunit